MTDEHRSNKGAAAATGSSEGHALSDLEAHLDGAVAGPRSQRPEGQPALGPARGSSAPAPPGRTASGPTGSTRSRPGLESRIDNALESPEPAGVAPSTEDGVTEVDIEHALVASAGAPALAYLVVVRGQGSGRTYSLTGGPWVLGRDSDCDVQLDSRAASTHHARIEVDGDRFRLVDLGSRNGTLLNGREVRRAVPLRNGDNVEIADSGFLFLTQDGEETQHTIAIEREVSEAPIIPVGAGAGPVAFTRPTGSYGRSPSEVRDADGESLEDQLRKLFALLAMIQRHWRKLVALPALLGALGLASVLFAPPPSEAAFVMKLSPELSTNPLDDGSPHRSNPVAEMRFYRDAERAFVDRNVVSSTLIAMGEAKPSATRVLALSNSLDFKKEEEGIYTGSFRDSNPEYAVTLLERHVENFIHTEVQKTLHSLQSEVTFLKGRVEEVESSLRKTEQQLREFKEKHLMDLPEFAGGRIATIGELQSRRGELAADAARLGAALRLAQQRLKREAPMLTAQAEQATPYRTALADVEKEIAAAEAQGWNDQHPEMRRLRRQAADLKRRAAAAQRSQASDFEREANPAYQQLKENVGDIRVQLTAAQTELGAVSEQIAQVSKIADAMPEVEAIYSRLTRSYQADKQLHERLNERLKQAQVKLELERASAEARYQVLTPPHSAGVPFRKAVLKRAGIGVGLGLFLAILVGAWLEFRALVRRLPGLRVGVTQSGGAALSSAGHARHKALKPRS